MLSIQCEFFISLQFKNDTNLTYNNKREPLRFNLLINVEQ